jgi:hypothetical protein
MVLRKTHMYWMVAPLLLPFIGESHLCSQTAERNDFEFLVKKIDEFRMPEKFECQLKMRQYRALNQDLSNQSKGALRCQISCQLWRDHNRWRFLYKEETFDRAVDGQRGYEAVTAEMIIDLDQNEAHEVIVSGGMKQGKFMKKNMSDKKTQALAFPWFYPHLSFVFFGSHPAPNTHTIGELLRSSKAVITTSERNGKVDRVVKAKSRWGEISVWIDPSKDFAPVAVHFVKGLDDWDAIPNRPIRNTGKVRTERGEVTMIGVNTGYDITRLEKCRAHWIPREFTVYDEMIASDQKKDRDLWEVVMDRFECDPVWREDVFRLSLAENGMRFYEREMFQIPYEYRDGELFKVVDEGSLEGLRGHRFVRGRWWTKGVMTLGLLALVVLGLGGFWRWRQKRVEG